MESELTQLEMDAVSQLIELSRGGAWKTAEQESNGDTHHQISSAVNFNELEALPRRKMRFRLLTEVYGFNEPPIKKRVR